MKFIRSRDSSKPKRQNNRISHKSHRQLKEKKHRLEIISSACTDQNITDLATLPCLTNQHQTACHNLYLCTSTLPQDSHLQHKVTCRRNLSLCRIRYKYKGWMCSQDRFQPIRQDRHLSTCRINTKSIKVAHSCRAMNRIILYGTQWTTLQSQTFLSRIIMTDCAGASVT